MGHTTIGRRGILAIGAAVVAGIATKGAAQPVAAQTTTATDFVANGNTVAGFETQGTFRVGVSGVGTEQGVFGSSGSGTGVVAFSTTGDAVVGTTFGLGVTGKTGVTGSASGEGNFGVIGSGATGVQGQGAQFGVVGKVGNVNNVANPVAVLGEDTSNVGPNSIGVLGKSASGTGVFGTSDFGIGVSGSGNTTGMQGVILATSSAAQQTFGVIGRNFLNRTDAIGVLGTSNHGVGVYGQAAAGLYGVRGDAGSAPGAAGLLGFTNQAGGVAFGSVVVAPATTAGFFGGRVVVNGDFAVTGTKSAAVKDAAGNHRLMYCVESPESWFEDVGEGSLAAGTATVTLDPDFAALIHTDTYHVFLTPGADSKGLFVTNKSASGFAVHEQQGGTSSLPFSWRVIAKRADVKGERLAKFTLPQMTMPEPIALVPAPPAPIALAPAPPSPPPPPVRRNVTSGQPVTPTTPNPQPRTVVQPSAPPAPAASNPTAPPQPTTIPAAQPAPPPRP